MSLQFNKSTPVYDFARKAVAFMAMNGRKEVRFRVTSHALSTMMQRKTSSEAEMMGAYKSHAERIHQIAEQKYGQHQFDIDGTVLVIQRDVAQRDDGATLPLSESFVALTDVLRLRPATSRRFTP